MYVTLFIVFFLLQVVAPLLHPPRPQPPPRSSPVQHPSLSLTMRNSDTNQMDKGTSSGSLKKNRWRKLCSRDRPWEDHAASTCCKITLTIWLYDVTYANRLDATIVKLLARNGISFLLNWIVGSKPTNCKITRVVLLHFGRLFLYLFFEGDRRVALKQGMWHDVSTTIPNHLKTSIQYFLQLRRFCLCHFTSLVFQLLVQQDWWVS